MPNQTKQHPMSLPFHPVIARPLEFITRIKGVRRVYDAPNDGTFDGFLSAMIGAIGFNYETKGELNIPSEGPLVIVANHPIGGPEGILLTLLLRKKRPDLKVITNRLLTLLPEFDNVFYGVENLKKGAAQRNASTIRKATLHVKNGGALMVFPAGMVSRFNFKKFAIEDLEWNSYAASLVKRYKTPCLPIYIKARNSTIFYILSSISRHFGTIMLPNEILNKRGKLINVIYGDLIQPERLTDFESTDEINDYLRLKTERLND